MLDRKGLLDVVRRIIEGEGSENEQDELIKTFLDSVSHPEALDVFGSSDDPEQIVDTLLNYQPRPIQPKSGAE